MENMKKKILNGNIEDAFKNLDNIVINSNGLYKGIKIQIQAEGVVAILRSKKEDVRSGYFKNTFEALKDLYEKVM